MDDHAIVQRGLAPRIIREAALALKYGRLALAIEKGRVVRVDRGE
jgi:ribonuclease D